MKKILKIFVLLLFLIPLTVNAEDFDIFSNNVIMINLKNDEIIYEKNKEEIINIASMQKVMTTITAIENINDFEEKLTIESGMFSGLDNDLLVLGLYAGEVVTYNDLLYATMLMSAADAAYALGYYISGSEEEFVKLMNKKAEELGLNNSVFMNTTGLDAEGQHSTVEDIAKLYRYALNNKDFKRIVSTNRYTTSDGAFEFTGPVETAHIIGMDYFLNGKTGFTEGAGLCLVSSANFNDVDYILVTAGADYNYKYQNFYDQKYLYDFYKDNYSFKTLVKKKDIITTIKTMYDDSVDIKASRDVTLYLNNNITEKDIDIVYEGEERLERGVNEGDKIGKYQIKYDDIVLYEEDVLSPVSVTFKLKPIFIIVLAVILLSIILRIIFKKRRRKRRIA